MNIYCYCDVQTFINIRIAIVRDPYPSSPGSGLMKMELWIAVDMLMNLLANMFNYGIFRMFPDACA
jgi:hypothetical protein